MKKNGLFRTLLALAVALPLTVACGSKEDPTPSGGGEGGSNLGTLSAAFASATYDANPGEKLSLPFTVNGVEGAALSVTATASDAAAKVTVSTDASYQGSVEFTAPSYSDGTPVTVTLNVNDPANKRTASATTTVKVAESDPLQVALVSDVKAMAAKAGSSFTLPVKISGATSKVQVESITASNGWKAECAIDADNAGGVITLTAPASVGSSVQVNLAVKDAQGRTASLKFDLEIIEISTAGGAANSFIVKPGSTVTITAVKGNSTQKLQFNTAGLVWQDELGMVKSVSGNGTEGVVVVQLNAGKSGNAVVAAMNDGIIVWSWHLWVTDYDPDADPFVFKASSGKTYTFMDRNLGARSATKYSADAFGLLYQWGRKDPFVGADGVTSAAYVKKYDIAGNRIYEESRERPHFSDHKLHMLDSSIANPSVFYSAPSKDYPVCDWLTNEGELQNHDLWGGVSGGKTIYDPCPEGWTVPASGEAWDFRKQYKKEGKLNDSGKYDPSQPWYIEYDDEYCIGFRYKDPSSGKEYWFPFAGEKTPNDGSLYSVGGGAQWHTRSTSNTLAQVQILAWGNPASVTQLNRPYASSIRCVKE